MSLSAGKQTAHFLVLWTRLGQAEMTSDGMIDSWLIAAKKKYKYKTGKQN